MKDVQPQIYTQPDIPPGIPAQPHHLAILDTLPPSRPPGFPIRISIKIYKGLPEKHFYDV